MMTHAWTLTQDRKAQIKVVDCSGALAPIQRQPTWASKSAERLFQCRDCGTVLSLVGDCVDWSMSAADWKVLGH